MTDLSTLTASRKVALGDIMKEARLDKEMGTRQLAAMTGLDRNLIQAIERGRVDASADVLKLICDALDRA